MTPPRDLRLNRLRSARSLASRGLFAVAAGLVSSLSAVTPASAHDGPEITQLIWQPGGDAFVMFSNRGVVFPQADAEGLSLLCTDSLAISTSERPDLALVSDGRLLVASSGGLRASADQGCSWQAIEPYGNMMTMAMAQDPHAADTLYLATFEPGAGGVHVTHDAGEHWTTLLHTEDDEFVQDLRISATDSDLLYASGQRITPGAPRTHFIAHSTDGGQSWTRFDIALLASETEVQLLAISPADPLTVLAKTTSREPMQRLLLSTDGGETWQPVWQTELLHDATILADGTTLWAASDVGLVRSEDSGGHFSPATSTGWMSCITEHQGELWACGQLSPEHNGVGVSLDGGATFEPRASLLDIAAPVECPEPSRTVATCEARWTDWQRESSSLVPSPNGTSGRVRTTFATAAAGRDAALEGDAGVSGKAGDATPAPAADSGGCSLSATGARSGDALAALLVLLALSSRRRLSPRAQH